VIFWGTGERYLEAGSNVQPSSDIEDFGEFNSPPPQSGGGGSITLFLSLYLLLLAFFILLVAISQGENPKAQEILEGLNSQFSSNQPIEQPRSFSSDLGNFVSPAEFFDGTAKVYEAAIPAAEIKVVTPGEVMEVDFHVGTLFKFGTEDLRPAQREVIGQLVPSLSRPPPGLRYQVEILFGFVENQSGYPVKENSLMRKAGIVARTFIEQGAPAHSVSIAMEPVRDDNRLRMIYRVLDEDKMHFGKNADLQDDTVQEITEPQDKTATQAQEAVQ